MITDQVPFVQTSLISDQPEINAGFYLPLRFFCHDLQPPQDADAFLGAGPAQRLVVGHADEAGLGCDEQAEVIAKGELPAFGGRLCQLVQLRLDSLQTDPFAVGDFEVVDLLDDVRQDVDFTDVCAHQAKDREVRLLVVDEHIGIHEQDLGLLCH